MAAGGPIMQGEEGVGREVDGGGAGSYRRRSSGEDGEETRK